MKTQRTSLVLLAAVVGILVFALKGFPYDRVLRVQDHKVITFDQMMQEKKDADIIVVGESHTEPKDHDFQLRVIRALRENGIPVVIGLEMFTAASQKALDDWVSGRMSIEQFLPVYYENWNIPWPLYRDIFLYAREYNIPLIGLNVPRSITTKVAREGFDALSAEELRQLPAGISCNIDDAYMKFIMGVHSAHMHGKEFRNFCEAQMVWDNAMALNSLAFLKRNPNYTMVILAGSVHAWKPAIPEQIRRQRGSHNVSVVLPEVPGKADKGRVTIKDADYLLLN